MPINLAGLVYRTDREPPASAPVDGELSAAEFDGNTLILAVALALLEAEKLSSADFTEVSGEVTPTTGDKLVMYRAGVPVMGDVSALPGTGLLAVVTHDGANAEATEGDTLSVVFAPGWTGTVQWQRSGVDIGGATAVDYVVTALDMDVPIRPVVTPTTFTAAAVTPTEPPPPPAVPAEFANGDWSIGGATILNVTGLPASGSAITALQYDINGSGTPIALSGTVVNTYTIAALTPGDSVRMRAVNAEGNGPWSTTPKVYSTGSGLAIVQDPAPVITGYGAGVTVTFGAALTATNGGLVVTRTPVVNALPATVLDDAGQTWSLVDSMACGESNFAVYARMNISGDPVESVTITFADSMPGAAKALEISGGGSSLVTDFKGAALAQSTNAVWTFDCPTSVDDALAVIGMSLTTGSPGVGATPLELHDMGAYYDQVAIGIFPAAGSNSGSVDFTPDSRNGTKRVLILRPGA